MHALRNNVRSFVCFATGTSQRLLARAWISGHTFRKPRPFIHSTSFTFSNQFGRITRAVIYVIIASKLRSYLERAEGGRRQGECWREARTRRHRQRKRKDDLVKMHLKLGLFLSYLFFCIIAR